MADACTRCGKCFAACPSVEPAGLAEADAVAAITGILEILRDGAGEDASRRWASICTFSGDCIKACDYGVNPRFLLAMARIAMTKAERDLPERRRRGSADFRNHHRGRARERCSLLHNSLLKRARKAVAQSATARAANLGSAVG